jgi:hypothetical protein
VAEDQGQRHRIVLFANVDVGLTDTGGGNSCEHLVQAGLIQIKLLEDEWSGLLSTTAARIRMVFLLRNWTFTNRFYKKERCSLQICEELQAYLAP